MYTRTQCIEKRTIIRSNELFIFNNFRLIYIFHSTFAVCYRYDILITIIAQEKMVTEISQKDLLVFW
jgi:hypothetical protein